MTPGCVKPVLNNERQQIRKEKMIRTVLAAVAAVLILPRLANTAEPVKVGVALSQTGNLAKLSSPTVQGLLDLLARAFDARGGLAGRQIEFIVYDDRSDPAAAARLYERLIWPTKSISAVR